MSIEPWRPPAWASQFSVGMLIRVRLRPECPCYPTEAEHYGSIHYHALSHDRQVGEIIEIGPEPVTSRFVHDDYTIAQHIYLVRLPPGIYHQLTALEMEAIDGNP